jgi:hypothetical protein
MENLQPPIQQQGPTINHLELRRQWKVSAFYTFCVKKRIRIFTYISKLKGPHGKKNLHGKKTLYIELQDPHKTIVFHTFSSS